MIFSVRYTAVPYAVRHRIQYTKEFSTYTTLQSLKIQYFRQVAYPDPERIRTRVFIGVFDSTTNPDPYVKITL